DADTVAPCGSRFIGDALNDTHQAPAGSVPNPLPNHPRMRLRRTLQTQPRQRPHSFKTQCHPTTIDVVGLMHQLRKQFDQTARVWQPLGCLVEEIVRVGVSDLTRSQTLRFLRARSTRDQETPRPWIWAASASKPASSAKR